MPKIDDNGVIREMTAEEIAEMERSAAHIPEPIKSEIEERLDKLENLFNKISSLLGVKK